MVMGKGPLQGPSPPIRLSGCALRSGWKAAVSGVLLGPQWPGPGESLSCQTSSIGCWAERCGTDAAGPSTRRPGHGLNTQGAWLARKILWFHGPGRVCACASTCVCMCGCPFACVPVCECMCTPGEGLWVNWYVAGMGTRGPSPPSRAGRNLGGKEGIETHHEIRASGGKKSPAPRGRPCPLCSGAPPQLR